MQTTILKKDFINALTIGGAMVGKNKTLPILESAKVEVTTDTLSVHSFNGESWVTKQTKVESADISFAFCINPNDLAKVLKSLVEEVVTFAIEGNLLRISHTKGMIEMPIVSSEQYPQAQEVSEGTSLTLNADKVKEWLSIATNFVANDELRPVMTGMYIYGNYGRMGVCATDAHKLFTDSIESDCEEFGVILPSSGFKPLLNIIANVSDVLAVIGTKNISFTTSDSALHCRLVEGAYPNFKAVIPQNNGVAVKVSKAELLDSVNRASLMANKTTSLLKLSVGDSVMGIEAHDMDFSTKASENVKVEKTGADVTIGVKSEFFATCLGIVGAEDVVLRLGDERRPVLFEDSLCKDRVMLVMPMMIN